MDDLYDPLAEEADQSLPSNDEETPCIVSFPDIQQLVDLGSRRLFDLIRALVRQEPSLHDWSKQIVHSNSPEELIQNLSIEDLEDCLTIRDKSAIGLTICGYDQSYSFPISLSRSVSVGKLKKRIQAAAQSSISKHKTRPINWRIVWRSNALSTKSGIILLEDRKSLLEYGIQNKEQLFFVPFLKEKLNHKHSKPHKYRLQRRTKK